MNTVLNQLLMTDHYMHRSVHLLNLIREASFGIDGDLLAQSRTAGEHAESKSWGVLGLKWRTPEKNGGKILEPKAVDGQNRTEQHFVWFSQHAGRK